MSTYIKLSTGEFPRHIGDIEIDEAGIDDYALVNYVEPPPYDSATHRCESMQPLNIDGQWFQQWHVREATPEEIEQANKPLKMPWELP